MNIRTRMVVSAAITVVLLVLWVRFVQPLRHHMDHGAGGHATWEWQGDVPRGEWLHLRNLNGPVEVDSSDDGRVAVEATKHWRRGRPGDVEIVTVKEDDGMYICALYGDNSQCGSEGYHTNTNVSWLRRLLGHRNDVTVAFEVHVPRGVKVDVSTVNGPVTVDGVAAEVKATTVNGPIKAETAVGPMKATTVNGPIVARIDSLVGTGDITLTTVNGSVTAELPDRLDADLDLSTINGRFSTDYPLRVTGSVNPRHLRTTLGSGGRQIRLKTVNGSVTLRRVSAADSADADDDADPDPNPTPNPKPNPKPGH